MSAALEKAIRERFAAAVAWARGAEASLVSAMRPREFPPSGVLVSGARSAAEVRAEADAWLDELAARLDPLTADAAETVRAFAVRLIADELDRAEVLDDPAAAKAATSGDVWLDALLLASAESAAGFASWFATAFQNGDSEGTARNVGGWTWPADVAPKDVLDWLDARGVDTSRLRKGVEKVGPGHPALRLTLTRGEREYALPLSGAAVLYSAERAIPEINPRRRVRVQAVPLDVGGAARRTYPALAGGVANGVEGSYTPDEARLVFSDVTKRRRRNRSTKYALTLPHVSREVQLNFEDKIELTLADVLAAVARSDYGVHAARALLGVSGLTALQGTAAGASAVIYWEELAGLLQVQDGRDFRRRILEALAGLGSVTLETRFADGELWRDRLVTVSGFGSVGVGVEIARALYRGVREKSGRPGRCWVPVPVGAMSDPRAALLAVILGSSFRASMGAPGGPVARFAASRLASLVGIRPRDGRTLLGDEYSRDLLAGPMRLLASEDFIDAAPELPDEGDPTLVWRPGALVLETFAGGKIDRGGRLPSTGDELRRYVETAKERAGRTAAAVAEELGVGLRTLREALDRGGLPLSGSVRRGLRRVHWGVAW